MRETANCAFAQDHGYIRIETEPYESNIYLDGELVSPFAPTELENIQFGDHVLVLENKEYGFANQVNLTINQDLSSLKIKASYYFKTIEILTNSENSSIEIDGKLVATKKFSGKLENPNSIIKIGAGKETYNITDNTRKNTNQYGSVEDSETALSENLSLSSFNNEPVKVDESDLDGLLEEAYKRSLIEINASHILIKLESDPSSKDEHNAYQKAVKIRERLMNGEDFESVAREISDDSSAKKNGGNLGYFTVFTMVYPFESMAYNTQIGSISQPFQTDFGYHILKVHDRRPARGQVKVAHIFIRKPEAITNQQNKQALVKAKMVYNRLLGGSDFADLARTYSEDPGSAKNGGEIPWFGVGRMIPLFEDACFALKKNGDFTAPIESFYGWHIIKLIDRKTVGSFEEEAVNLKAKIEKDKLRYSIDKKINDTYSPQDIAKEEGFVNDGNLKVVYPNSIEIAHSVKDVFEDHGISINHNESTEAILIS